MFNKLSNRNLVRSAAGVTVVILFAACSPRSKSVVKRPSRTTVLSTPATVKSARDVLKTRYMYGGSSKSGFDCSGLVYYVYQREGMSVPRTSAEQAKRGQRVSLSTVRPGDLIFFGHGGKVQHVGIVSRVGGKYPTMIHASSSKGVVEEDIDDSTYWQRRLLYLRRW